MKFAKGQANTGKKVRLKDCGVPQKRKIEGVGAFPITAKIRFIDTNIIAHWILGNGGILKDLCSSQDLSNEFLDIYVKRYKPAIDFVDAILTKKNDACKDEFYITSLTSNELFSAIRDEIRSILFFRQGIPISRWRDSRNNPDIPEEVYLEIYKKTLESFDFLFENHGITIIPEVSPWDDDQYWSIVSSILFLIKESKTQDATILTTSILNGADYFITLDKPLISSAKDMLSKKYRLKLLNPTEGFQELKKR